MALEQNLFQPSTSKNFLGLVSIVISPTDLCNRTCTFCPHSIDFPNDKNYMDLGVADKLSGELKILGYEGIVSISGYGEPLLHPFIGSLIRTFTTRGISTRLITNGDRILNGKITPKEIDDWNLLSIKIDCYDGQKDVDKMNYILKDLKTIKRISTGPDNITNRAGYLFKEKINMKCYQPLMKAMIDWDGQVYICCEDWSKQNSFGTIAHQNFNQIWMSEKLTKVRRQLMNSQRIFSSCINCNVKPTGSLNEKESFRIWNNYK